MKRLFASIAFLCAFVLAAGCGDPHAVNQTANQTRAFNAVVGLSSVSLSTTHGAFSSPTSDSTLTANIGFGGVTQYVPAAFGNAGASLKNPATGAAIPLSVSSFTELQNYDQTLIVAGEAGGTGVNAPRVLILQDIIPTNTNTGTGVNLRVVNLSPDGGSLSLYGNPSPTFPLAGGQIGLSNVTYLAATPYVFVTTGTDGELYLSLYDTTQTDPNTGGPLQVSTNLDKQGYDLTTGAALTAFIIGARHPSAGQQPLQVVLTIDQPNTTSSSTVPAGGTGGTGGNTGSTGASTAQERSLNALVSPLFSSVSFAQNSVSNVIASSVAYGSTPSYVTVPSGSSITAYLLGGSSSTPLAQATQNLIFNTKYTQIATGIYTTESAMMATGPLSPQLLNFADNFPTTTTLGTTNTALRFINAAPSSTAAFQSYDILSAGQPLTGLTSVAFGTASSGTSANYITIPAGTYNLTLRSTSTGAPITLPTTTANTLSSLLLQAGNAYTLVAIGSPDNIATSEGFNILVLKDN